MYLRFPAIQQFSFWFGFILATLLWWIIIRLRPVIIKAREDHLHSQTEEKSKTRAVAAFENRYLHETLKYAQGMHLAASMFRLDEILQEVRLLTPPRRIEPGSPVRNEDITETTIPYLPTWPELASNYKVATLSLADALRGDANIVILGNPGMGKSVALASLASSIARRDPAFSSLDGKLPILLHCAELDNPISDENPILPVIETMAERAATNDKSRIPDFIRKSFDEGRILLLLDGVDELTGDYYQNVIHFIKLLRYNYPKTRIVITSSFEQQWDFVQLFFSPLPIASWSGFHRQQFLNSWAKLWTKYNPVDSRAENSTNQPDSLLLGGWLSIENRLQTPFELTLKIWGAYAGDLSGPRIVDDLESHIRRLTPSEVPVLLLDQLASVIHLANKPVIDLLEDHEWLISSEFSETILTSNPEQTPPSNREEQNSFQGYLQTPVHDLLSSLVKSGLFTQHRKNHIRYTHPIYGGYLAGKDFRNIQQENFPEKSTWIGKSIAFHYLACIGDASFLAERYLSSIDRPLMQNLLFVARWLRDAPRESSWREGTLPKLVELIQQEDQPLGLRGQALSVLIEQSNEVSVSVLLRRWLESEKPGLLLLAALGAGLLRDPKAVELLAELTKHNNLKVRSAACLALASIGSPPSVDILADILLHGDDSQRRTAAEALSNLPGEGYAILKEGATLKEDVMVRRACAFGLGRISEPWAEKLLILLQTNDDQWAVRNAASEVLEDRLLANPHIPNRLPPVSESSWLIAYAGKKGIGISPEETPIEILLSVLRTGNLDEKIASLDYLKSYPTENVLGEMITAMLHGESDLREAAYFSLSELALGGLQIPDPANFEGPTA